MSNVAELLADLYQVLGALMQDWEKLGIKPEHMDALIAAQKQIEQEPEE